MERFRSNDHEVQKARTERSEEAFLCITPFPGNEDGRSQSPTLCRSKAQRVAVLGIWK